MKRPGFNDASWEPSRWVWLRVLGKTYAFAPDAYAHAADLVAAVLHKSRGTVPHALLVILTVNELVDRGWMRIEVERTASGRRRFVIKLVPPEERPPPRAKRRKRSVARASSDQSTAPEA